MIHDNLVGEKQRKIHPSFGLSRMGVNKPCKTVRGHETIVIWRPKVLTRPILKNISSKC